MRRIRFFRRLLPSATVGIGNAEPQVGSILERKLNVILGRNPKVGWKPAMDLHKIISELQSEKQRLDEAIQALERLSSVSQQKVKKRGRPPVNKADGDQVLAAAKTASQQN